MATLIGLDIGSFAVRAAEVDSTAKATTLRRFAEVPLPHGAVSGGKVIDVYAVGAALRRLWADGKFSSKRVVVGLSSQAVIVRQADIASVPDSDLQSAIRFEAQELVPFPLEEALLSAQVLQRDVIGSAPAGPTMRILLAAAPRETVSTHLAAVRAGGLEPLAVDVGAVAMMRALPEDHSDADGRSVDAVVSIGADLTTIAVREHATPRFVRVLNGGGSNLTDAIAADLGVDRQRAEDLKREAGLEHESAGASHTHVLSEVQDILAASTEPLVEAIAGSLDFYRAQNRIASFRRIWLTGGSVVAPGLVDRLRDVLGPTVEIADPVAWYGVPQGGGDGGHLSGVAPALLAPIGLALWSPKQGQISLLPEEIVLARRRRRHAAVAVGVAALVTAGLASAFVGRTMEVHRARTQASMAQAQLAPLQAEITQLQGKVTIRAEVASYQAEVKALLADDVDWDRLLGQIAAEMPGDVSLSSFSGSTDQPGASTGNEIGTVTFNATANDGKLSVAAWLVGLDRIPALSGTWVSNLTSASDDTSDRAEASFESYASLTDTALSAREAKAGGTP